MPLQRRKPRSYGRDLRALRVLRPSDEQTIGLAEKMPSPRMIRFFDGMPFFVRKAAYWNLLFWGPFRVKRTVGTVSVATVGMLGKASGGSCWGIPVGFPR